MRVALVFPPFYLDSMYNLPPLGLITLATMLKGNGHEVVIHDFVLALRTGELPFGRSLYDRSAESILALDPDLVAFSTQCTTLPPVLQIAERLKKLRSSLKIVLGGHTISFVDQRAMAAFHCIDAVVRGEGELTFQELVAAYASDRGEEDVAGVTWRRRGTIRRNPDRPLLENLDIIPAADYGLVAPLHVYRDACGLPRSIVTLEVGRGCPHQCVYCSESIFWRRRSRTFSIERLIREMHHLRSCGAECFLLAYDQFTANRRFVERFCHAVIDEGLNELPWYCISRLDTVDPTLLGLMRRAGCESMCYGIDSGSERTLHFIRKRIDRSILSRRVAETTAAGIVPTLSFVIGFPEEQEEDIESTLELALQCGLDGTINPLLQLPTVLPGTELHERFAAGLVRTVDTYFALGLEFDRGRRLAEDEELIGQDPILFSSFYNLACPGMELESLDRLVSLFPLVISLYPRSFMLLAKALSRPYARLFEELLAHVRTSVRPGGPLLTAADCLAHFPSFAGTSMSGVEAGWDHLPEMVRYESNSLEAGGAHKPLGTAGVDLCRAHKKGPRRREMIIDRFSFDLPMIIGELREGILRSGYPLEETWLVFLHRNGGLEVIEVNRFGRELLQLCDGTRSVEEIASALHDRYGRELALDPFVRSCRQALMTLSGLDLVELPVDGAVIRSGAGHA
jgi:radical SAM superfamily enzyme YgiQ (UPF0313 family)